MSIRKHRTTEKTKPKEVEKVIEEIAKPIEVEKVVQEIKSIEVEKPISVERKKYAGIGFVGNHKTIQAFRGLVKLHGKMIGEEIIIALQEWINKNPIQWLTQFLKHK